MRRRMVAAKPDLLMMMRLGLLVSGVGLLVVQGGGVH